MDKRKKRLFSCLATFCICLGAIFISQSNKIKDLFNMDSVVVNNGESNKIKLAKYSTDGKSLTIKASIDEEVTDRTVSWKLDWVDGHGSDFENYVSISSSSDTLTCTVTFKKAFTTRLILTCTSNSNTSVKATAYIDYVGRTHSDEITGLSSAVLGTDSTSAQLFKTATIQSFVEKTFNVKHNLESTGGTLKGQISYEHKYNGTNGTIYLADMREANDCFVEYAFQQADKLILKDLIVAKYGKNSSTFQLIQNDGVIGFPVTYTITYNNQTFATGETILWYSFDWNVLEIFADNVTLDDSQLIF